MGRRAARGARERGALREPPTNAVERLLEPLTADPSRALVLAEGRAVSAGELDERSRSLAAGWSARGVGPGDRVAARLESSLEAVAAFLAAWRLRAVWVPLNPKSTPAETAAILDDCGPKLLLDGSVGAARALDTDAPPVPDTALLVYTSGTTGRSKGCMLSAANVVDANATLMAAWGMSGGDVLVHALPLFHVHGLCVALCGALLAGARIDLVPRFSPEAVVGAVGGGGTVFMGVPTMYRRLLDHLAERPDEARALAAARLFCSGSAPLAAADFEEFAARTGHRIVERYGMSETQITLSNPLEGPRKPGTVGRPLPGVSIRVVDDELWVKGPGVMRGYLGDEAATRAAFADGWLKTGDAVSVDADGWVTILGRLSVDFVKVGGHKVSAREVEIALAAHPGVREVAVVGVPDREWGERVVACVVPAAEPPSLESLAAAADLSAHKRPRGLLLLDALPRNAMGKVQKRALAALAAERAGS